MNSYEMGKLICRLRKEAGLTQSQLADFLCVTDKAVSKWERGISFPDSTLLPKIAIALDCDIDTLVADYENNNINWYGIIDISDTAILSTVIHDKAVIDYLLSYYILVGIKKVYLHGLEQDMVDQLKLEQYGISALRSFEKNKNYLVVYGKPFVYGAGLTRQFQNIMSMEEDTALALNGDRIPILFLHNVSSMHHIKTLEAHAIKKTLSRGIVYISMETQNGRNDASEFVRICQNNTGVQIANLTELAKNRKMI